jgi:hypothetical protein
MGLRYAQDDGMTAKTVLPTCHLDPARGEIQLLFKKSLCFFKVELDFFVRFRVILRNRI